MRFRNGVIGTIDNCRQVAYGCDPRVEVFGSLGKIATENRYSNQAIVSTGSEVRSDLPLHFFMDHISRASPKNYAASSAPLLTASPRSWAAKKGAWRW
jgi:myo-inositol 2-dehydrogenase / D-chiro-inositol 1-dehydrogenase